MSTKRAKVALIGALGVTVALGLSACGDSTDSTPAEAAPSASATAAEVEPSMAPSPDETVAPSPVATVDVPQDAELGYTVSDKEPMVDEATAIRVTVKPGDYFTIPAPEGLIEASMSGGDITALNFVVESNPDTVTRVEFSDIPADFDTSTIVQGGDAAGDLWLAGDVKGDTNIKSSYTDPKSGETITAEAIITIQ